MEFDKKITKIRVGQKKLGRVITFFNQPLRINFFSVYRGFMFVSTKYFNYIFNKVL